MAINRYYSIISPTSDIVAAAEKTITFAEKIGTLVVYTDITLLLSPIQGNVDLPSDGTIEFQAVEIPAGSAGWQMTWTGVNANNNIFMKPKTGTDRSSSIIIIGLVK